jgi:hypothetical protein
MGRGRHYTEYKRFTRETKDWNSTRWKRKMNINKVKPMDYVEGIWFGDGYVKGLVSTLKGVKGIKGKGVFAALRDAYAFRKVSLKNVKTRFPRAYMTMIRYKKMNKR